MTACRSYGRWPWSRELLARLIDNLTRHAGTIGLDILLSEPQSPTADLALLKPGLVSGKNCVPIRTHCRADVTLRGARLKAFRWPELTSRLI